MALFIVLIALLTSLSRCKTPPPVAWQLPRKVAAPFSGISWPPHSRARWLQEGNANNESNASVESSQGTAGGEGTTEGEGTAEREGAAEGEKEEGEKEEAEEAEDSGALSGGFLLLNSIGGTMILLALVNNSRASVRAKTWETINATVSVFIAVLYYQFVDAILDSICGDEASENAGGGRVAVAALHFSFWVCVDVANSAYTARTGRMEGMSFKASKFLIAHVCSFGYKDIFNTVMHLSPFDENVGMAVVSILVVLACFAVCVLAFLSLVPFLIPKDLQAEMYELYNDTILDVISVSLGFAIVQVLRFAYMGKLPSADLLEADIAEHSAGHSLGMFGTGLFFVLCSFICIVLQKRLKESPVAKVFDYCKNICILTAAWTVMFWGDLSLVPVMKSEFMGLVLMSSIFSTYAIVWLFVVEKCLNTARGSVAQSFAEVVIIGNSWLVALPWEQTFDVASESLSETTDLSAPVSRGLITLVVSIVVIPSWVWYIVPKASSTEAEEEIEEEQEEQAKKAAQVHPEGDDPKPASAADESEGTKHAQTIGMDAASLM